MENYGEKLLISSMEKGWPRSAVAIVAAAAVAIGSVGITQGSARAASTLTVGDGQAYATVQAAVNAASAGDTVVIEPGTYAGNVVIDKPLTLLGANSGVSGNMARGAESIIVATSSGSAAIQASQAVTIDGVLVQQAAITASNNNSAITLAAGSEGSSVRNSVLQKTRVGVTVASSTTRGATILENNLISGWTGFAVRSVTSHGLTVRHNAVAVAAAGAESSSAGVFLEDTNINSIVQANVINAKTGISFDARGATSSTGARFVNNAINLNQVQTNPRGIVLPVRNASDLKVAENRIAADGVLTTITGMSSANTALASAPVTQQVEISGNTIADARYGILFSVAVRDILITENHITASERGVSFAAGGKNARVTKNVLTRADTQAGYGVIVQASFEDSEISHNTIVADYALYGAAPNFKNIVFSNNDVTSMRGARLAGPTLNFSVTDNVFKTTGTSISTNNTQDGLVVTGNQIIGGIDGMAFTNSSGADELLNSTIEGNSFTGLTGSHISGLSQESAVVSATARGNYWTRTNSHYPVFSYVNVDGSRALPIDPFTGADNTPAAVSDHTGAAEFAATVSGGELTVDLSGAALLGVIGAANEDVYPYTVAEGEWIKVYFVTAGVWSDWLQAPANGVLKVPVPSGTTVGESVLFVNFAGDVFGQVPADKLGIAPAIQTEKLAAGMVGKSYLQKIAASGTAPLTLKVTSGAIPAGLALSAAGVISGKPTKQGNFRVAVTATNAVGSASREYSVVVTNPAVRSAPCTPMRKVPVFADVPLDQKFYREIDWMHCMKLSTGWHQSSGKPIYKPKEKLSREAMAAFIYRMEAPKNYKAPKVSPFADVQPGDAFYKEIAWMWDVKLSTGYAQPGSKPNYHPQEELSREAMAAFIYRLESPKGFVASNSSQLADMKPGMKFFKEISWMYTEGLTTGNRVGNTKEFWPKDKVTREAMAAFIYRLVTDYRHGAIPTVKPLRPKVNNAVSEAEFKSIEIDARSGATVSVNPLGDTSLARPQPLTEKSYSAPSAGSLALGVDNELLVTVPRNGTRELRFKVAVYGEDGAEEIVTYVVAIIG